ncbi:hypothetical protein JHK85_030531 [Glycine max]|nr:hypothetical protein JHK85_030531 [Glycine max]
MATSQGGNSYRNARTSLKPHVKSKPSQQRRNSTGSVNGKEHAAAVPGRVRVAVRLRPRNAEESVADADFADCVELQPELKRLKLRKNNWDADTYEFDEVLTEFSSQKRVYEVVARPVVEVGIHPPVLWVQALSVLDGYNGTIMAYGQTGTGKTYTLGRLGEEDNAARGIMVRAMEDILADVSLDTDSVSVSYLQLYMETIQDLLDPANDNITIVEDPKTGDVSLPGASLVDIRDKQSFVELLRLGEAHRFAANTKLNTESSRSHAILMAMKVENMVKLKEEFDYKSLSRRLDIELDKLIVEHERQQKTFEDEIERLATEAQHRISEAERNYVDSLELSAGNVYIDIAEVDTAECECNLTRRQLDRDGLEKEMGGLNSLTSQVKHQQQASGNGEKPSIAKLFEQVGLQKILSLLEAEDADVRIHAVKVVANLAAEETNQGKIVEAGGLTSLLNLLKSSHDETIHRVAAGAIANLAMNETNQELIMAQGGISLLSMTAANAEDPQTLRMVAGAIANLCGNDKLQTKLRSEGGIKALLGMVRCRHPDVHAQVARGIANFAKCESRASSQGTKSGRSFLIEDGALPWIVQNANNEAASVRRHIELALCHLAQHEINARDMISGGALWELVRISRDCSREDIKTLAHRTLVSSPTFQAEMRRLRYSSREAFLFSVLAEILDERNCVSEFLYVVDPSLNDHNLIKSKWCLSFRLLVSSNWDVN